MKTYCIPAVLLALSGCAFFNPGGRTVRVSDFGHDLADSTRYLQAALDSGADTVIVDAKRWVTLPLRVRSDQEIVLEKGAVIEAKKGEYLGKYDSVLNFVGVSNVVLRGDGEIRMWHDDYLKPPYAKAEWRHCVNILGCDKVTIRGLRLLQGGGDGVYVGALTGGRLRSWRMTTAHPWSSNIVLEDLYIDTHVRQGMSVTSCKGLTADRCVFKNTWGLPPQAGVDLEPNSPDNPITGMVFRDCTFENNKGAGFEFALSPLNPKTSEPFDCRFERCRFVRNNLTVHNIRRDHSQIGGKLVVKDCVFIEPREMPLAVGVTPDRPFEFSTSGCRIIENGVETAIDEAWLLRNAPLLSPGGLVSCERAKVDFSTLKIVDLEPGVPHKLAQMKFRNRVRFAVFADRARKLEFKGGLSVLGSYKPKKELSPLVIEDVEGKQIAEIELPVYDAKNPPSFSFEAPSCGFYFIRAEMGRNCFVLASADAPVAVDVTKDWQDLIYATGKFSFYVPEGAARFGVLVGGDGVECVSASVKDPSGETVWRHGCLSAWTGLVMGAGARHGLWTLTLGKPEKGCLEDERVDLFGIPGFFFLDSTRYWKGTAD